jgi:hypothetical protein
MNVTPSFNELPWHDAELRGLSVDRRQPGIVDRVSLSVCWPDGTENEIQFRDCYALSAEMNFGVIAREAIFAARISQDAPGSTEIRRRWEPVGVRLDDLVCFEIETSSTGSTLRIYAKSFEVRALKPSGR